LGKKKSISLEIFEFPQAGGRGPGNALLVQKILEFEIKISREDISNLQEILTLVF